MFVLPLWMRHAPDERHHQRGEQRDDMDDDPVRRQRPVNFFEIDEVFENLNQRNTSDGQCDLDLQDAAVNVVEPLRTIRRAGDVKAMDEDAVSTLHNHDDEVRYHAGVNKAEQHDHQGLHVPCKLVYDEAVVIHEERHDVQCQRDNQRDVDGIQNPSDRKDRVTSLLRECVAIKH